MLIAIFIAIITIFSFLFGMFFMYVYYTERTKKLQLTVLETSPTAMLEMELHKRGKREKTAYR